MLRPVALTPEQITSIHYAADHVEPSRRAEFFQHIANALKNRPHPIGDGDLFRAIMSAQRSARSSWRAD